MPVEPTLHARTDESGTIHKLVSTSVFFFFLSCGVGSVLSGPAVSQLHIVNLYPQRSAAVRVHSQHNGSGDGSDSDGDGDVRIPSRMPLKTESMLSRRGRGR